MRGEAERQHDVEYVIRKRRIAHDVPDLASCAMSRGRTYRISMMAERRAYGEDERLSLATRVYSGAYDSSYPVLMRRVGSGVMARGRVDKMY